MDKMLWVAMSGAKENMNSVAVRANNLANANTTGFKADLQQARAMQAFGEGLPTRVFSMTESPGQNFASGAIQATGRNMDVAIKDQGWIAVDDGNGNERYTRNGSLEVGTDGMLKNSNGQTVLGDNGPIFVPMPIDNLVIGSNGNVSIRPMGAPADAMEVVDRIKLVNPPNGNIEKGNDGLFKLKDGQQAFADANVKLEIGALEGSNVNSVEEMTHMIALQRQYEMNVKLMKTADENAQRSESLMRMS
ncbi:MULTISPECIES: flagellar basal-body rod protein FlgF [Idiomarina]|jgi:flagellar basal-body rod protein FlgF|uniref:Flagellar basal-body rod protein FlgF n=2 Tax=Idiomarina abyssalis TaxID=86102 RepID=A0A8I1G8R8_9GAMM|nr:MULTISPECIES: flagellar basal-body rod protein FlgF [Idiomarina]RDX35130.1 flagellar basal-body rod protein FlgF [Idiomarina sp. HD9-110m-PIT-SAG05]KPD22127.1 flagellar basal body rod protein FlgF [Idiomarina abyssalis]MAO67480.1 flagellar basal-body rod protein FlgF [Idiomarina sp.]MBF80337.1 flagellar basal-body rod protein FlgF [Idiomarina sp.]MBJ7265400.1 flagellar basal-body rod protein FlgF [Idiomarina abyssalis]|tara:strand:+ start:7962 stop:8705 length:744 start_codon:yes stop_codon:yes gene_type:complete